MIAPLDIRSPAPSSEESILAIRIWKGAGSLGASAQALFFTLIGPIPMEGHQRHGGDVAYL